MFRNQRACVCVHMCKHLLVLARTHAFVAGKAALTCRSDSRLEFAECMFCAMKHHRSNACISGAGKAQMKVFVRPAQTVYIILLYYIL